MTTELLWQKIFRTTSCPTCKAKPGERCRGEYKAILPNHESRVDLFERVEAKLNPKKDRWQSLGTVGGE